MRNFRNDSRNAKGRKPRAAQPEPRGTVELNAAKEIAANFRVSRANAGQLATLAYDYYTRVNHALPLDAGGIARLLRSDDGDEWLRETLGKICHETVPEVAPLVRIVLVPPVAVVASVPSVPQVAADEPKPAQATWPNADPKLERRIWPVHTRTWQRQLLDMVVIARQQARMMTLAR